MCSEIFHFVHSHTKKRSAFTKQTKKSVLKTCAHTNSSSPDCNTDEYNVVLKPVLTLIINTKLLLAGYSMMVMGKPQGTVNYIYKPHQ